MKTILGVEISNWGPSGVRNVLVDVFERKEFVRVFFKSFFLFLYIFWGSLLGLVWPQRDFFFLV